jgi:type IV pilus assembly protein PilM
VNGEAVLLRIFLPRLFEPTRAVLTASEEVPHVPFWKKEVRFRRRRGDSDADVRDDSTPGAEAVDPAGDDPVSRDEPGEPRRRTLFGRKQNEEAESESVGLLALDDDLDEVREERPRWSPFGRKPKDEPESEFDDEVDEVREERPRWSLFSRKPNEDGETESVDPVALEDELEEMREERPRWSLFGRKPAEDGEEESVDPVALEDELEEVLEERPRRRLFGRKQKADDAFADDEGSHADAEWPDQELPTDESTAASTLPVEETVLDLAAGADDGQGPANEQVSELLAWWDEIQRSVGSSDEPTPNEEPVAEVDTSGVALHEPEVVGAAQDALESSADAEPVPAAWVEPETFTAEMPPEPVETEIFAVHPSEPQTGEDSETAALPTAEIVPVEPVVVAPEPVGAESWLDPVPVEPDSMSAESEPIAAEPVAVVPEPIPVTPEPIPVENQAVEFDTEPVDEDATDVAERETSGSKRGRFGRRRPEDDGVDGSKPRRGRRLGKSEDAEPKRTRSKSKPSRGAKKVVGLKIGASQLAAATIANNGSPELVQIARQSLEPGIVVGGELRDPEALAEALTEFFKKHKLPKKGVRLGLASNRIGVRSFEIVGIDDPKQLTNAVRFRAQDALPIPLGEAALDYQVLEESVDETGASVRRVLLVVVYRDLVERYVRACNAAGIKLLGIDLEAFAVLRALAEPRPEEVAPAGALVVVNVGHDRSTLAVSDGRFCEFTRVLDWGGASLDVALARALNATPSEVAPLKRSLDLDVPAADATLEQAREVVLEQINVFARELVSSLHFYQSQPESLEIGEIVLTGGGSHLTGLAARLEQLTGVNVRVGDPLGRVHLKKNVAPADPVGSLAVAIGLGIED